jgi:hypothetical protein
MKPGNCKFNLEASNEALAISLSIKSTFWSLKLSSGSTPVDKSNVLEVKIKLWLDACQ